jgi:acyl-CoA synthetase (AMP-forming)/AMP-acid ligase II
MAPPFSPEHRPIETLPGLLRARCAAHPDSEAYAFVSAGSTAGMLTYAELDARARAIAAVLRRRAKPGALALLLYAPGLDFVSGFFGCLYAGLVAVPAYPPFGARLDRAAARLEAIVEESGIEIVLAGGEIAAMRDSFVRHAPRLDAAEWLATDRIARDAGESDDGPEASADSPAIIQFTSGSTSSPRGVVLTHAGILHNSRHIFTRFDAADCDRVVSWLPPYHDMGLIGGILQTLYMGCPVTMMSPLEFLARPLSWLELMARTGAQVSGGPNFAYELCVRRTTPEERKQLDLSRWRLAFTGAETIRKETLERFTEAFAPAGFDPRAWLPCYGLAEATLLVTCASPWSRPVELGVDRSELERGRVVCCDPDAATAKAVVACGAGLDDQSLAIVDPTTLRRCEPDEIGEIWISGPSVGQGYWRKPFESELVFAARLVDEPETRWLRTGDLGFLSAGVLYLTGRLKDVIVLHGRNIYPEDVERAAESCHPAVRAGCGAAFGVELEGDERIVLVQEVRDADLEDRGQMFATLRGAIGAAEGIALHEIVLIRPQTIAKTSSGKIRRGSVRADYLADRLAVVDRDGTGARPAAAAGTPAAAPANALERQIAAIWSELLEVESLGRDENFFDLGGSSLAFARALDRIREIAGIGPVSIVTLFRFPTVRSLAGYLASGTASNRVFARVHERVEAQRSARRRFAERVAGRR